MFTRREFKRYVEADTRIRLSIMERVNGNPDHDYPRREGDLSTLYHFHNAYGVPEPGVKAWAKRWWCWIRGGVLR